MGKHLDRATAERWQRLMSQWENAGRDLANVKSLLGRSTAAPAEPHLEKEATRLTDELAALQAEIDQTIKNKQSQRDPNGTDLVVATLHSGQAVDLAHDEDAPVLTASEREH